MYKCQLCGVSSAPRVPATRIIIESRAVTYVRRERANACIKRSRNKFGEFISKFVHTDDRGGRGQECVNELTVCPNCAAQYRVAQRGQTLQQPLRE